jgi:broad specificity phosphatase PhoE
MLLYLIRHGETDWNLERRCQGFSDSPLNETGLRQAEATARHLSDEKIDAVYSSSLRRAHEMARMIAEHHKVSVQTSDALRELNQGEFEGLTFPELLENHAEFLQQWLRDPADLRIPAGESMRELQARAWAELEEIVKKHNDGNVVVVSHNLCIATLLCQIMNLDLADFRRIQLDVATINIVEFAGRWPHPVVIRMNDTCHLK